MESTLAEALWLDFAAFVQSRDDIGKSDIYPNPEHDASWLTHYIAVWLEEGDAVLVARGDFGAYLRGVILIVMKWHWNNSVCDFKGAPGKEPFKRRVTTPARIEFELDEHPAFDPNHFKEVCLRRGIQPTLRWLSHLTDPLVSPLRQERAFHLCLPNALPLACQSLASSALNLPDTCHFPASRIGENHLGSAA